MTNTELYAVAKKHIGEGGSKARSYCGLPSGAAWCNAYVCYIANEGGVKNLYFNGTKQTYCPTSIKWCDANLAMVPPYLAMPMDIIYFDWEKNGVPNHIGFVKAKKSSEDIYTHEGNTNNSVVAEKVRTVGYVQGIYRPHFKPSEADKKAEIVCDGDFGWQSIYALQRALKLTSDGILGKDTVKALQKKAGVSADGAWGKGTSKAVQKMVGTTVDGAFGKNSVIALQKWVNVQNGSSPSPEPSPEPTPSKKSYTGALPDFVLHSGYIISDLTKQCAWAKGTPSKKWKYIGGDSYGKFKSMLNKAYPNRSGWGKRPKVGASCDVFSGTMVRASGMDSKYPRGLAEQLKYYTKNFKVLNSLSLSDFRAGDIVRFARKGSGGHTLVLVDVGGVLYKAEASYGTNGEEYSKYGHITGKATGYKKSSYNKIEVIRCNHPIRSWIANGDTGSEVLKVQKFLNWYGFKLTEDRGYGAKCVEAVKKFQEENGLTVDGEWGSSCNAKAKEIKR